MTYCWRSSPSERYLDLALAEVTASIPVIFFTGISDVNGLRYRGIAETQKQKTYFEKKTCCNLPGMEWSDRFHL